jgi:CheY-like chemotaxis protein
MNKRNNKLVLVIEDEVPLREAIVLKLKKSGLEICAVGTAEAALEAMEKELPDFIWLDLLMPGMGGLTFLEQIRSDERYRNIPVMIVSVSAGPEKMKRAFELNIVDYVVKSEYTLESIIHKVKALI